jgi:hypothetical protein
MNIFRRIFGNKQSIRNDEYNRMTKTGETFGERKSYHQRGELSPGEHAMARAIREHLEATGAIPRRKDL